MTSPIRTVDDVLALLRVRAAIYRRREYALYTLSFDSIAELIDNISEEITRRRAGSDGAEPHREEA
jgi:hypothetical protein